MIEKRVRIDMDIDTCPLLYTVQQNEENSRKIIISFTTNGVPFQIDTFTRVMVQLDKPDGTTVLEDSDGDYLNIVDNTVELIFSKQMTVASGRILGKLMFFDKESMVATTLFSINVNNGLIEESKIISSDEYSALINALIRVEEGGQATLNKTIEYSEKAKVSEENAATSASEAETHENNASTYADNSKSYSEESKTYSENAKQSETNAENSATASANSATESENFAKLSKSYTNGGTGLRENEETDNSKYYYTEIIKMSEEIHGAANPMTGATETEDGKTGLVPKPYIADRERFLKGDGSWADVVVDLHYKEASEYIDPEKMVTVDMVVGLQEVAKTGILKITDDTTKEVYTLGIDSGKLYIRKEE